MKTYTITDKDIEELITNIEMACQDGDWWYVNKVEEWVLQLKSR